MANKAIDKDYLLVQLQNFAKKIGSNFVAKESGKSLISDTDIKQIATNTQSIKDLKNAGVGMNEATVKLLISEDIAKLKSGANENYDTFGEISDWIINTGSTVTEKADSFTYDESDGALILYAGSKPLSQTKIIGGGGDGNYFVPPTFEVFFEQSDTIKFSTTGHLIMTGGKGAEFRIDPITGHLFEGEEV